MPAQFSLAVAAAKFNSKLIADFCPDMPGVNGQKWPQHALDDQPCNMQRILSDDAPTSLESEL